MSYRRKPVNKKIIREIKKVQGEKEKFEMIEKLEKLDISKYGDFCFDNYSLEEIRNVFKSEEKKKTN